MSKEPAIGEFGFPELPGSLNVLDWKELSREFRESGWGTPQSPFGYCKPPNIPAVYIFVMLDKNLYEKCAIAYVGMSRQIGERFTNHPKFHEISKLDYHLMRYFLPVPQDELRSLERDLMQRFNPPWNIQGKVAGIVQ
jgi:hypothetical protein